MRKRTYRKKRGQFYLLAAIIIIAAIIGLATVSNYLISNKSDNIYNLKEELSIEAEEVLNYGVLEQDTVDWENLTESFTQAFDHRVEGEEIYFIFGNDEDVKAYKYDDEDIGTITYELGGEAPAFTVLQRAKNEITPTRKSSENFDIKIEDQVYTFDLNPGENFYFIIKTKQGGQTNVATS